MNESYPSPYQMPDFSKPPSKKRHRGRYVVAGVALVGLFGVVAAQTGDPQPVAAESSMTTTPTTTAPTTTRTVPTTTTPLPTTAVETVTVYAPPPTIDDVPIPDAPEIDRAYAPVPAPVPFVAPVPAPAPYVEPAPAPYVEPATSSVYYKNCTAARAAGAAPVYAGQPGYASHLDRDGDGVGCE